MHTLKINGKMGLFQKSVLKSYLNQQNKDVVEKAYIRFKKIYDSANIEEIKKLKEEEYQTGFFNDIFINVLGYTLRPTKGFNFKVEQKNVTDSKKADGAILNAKEEIIGVVELKSTATKNLDLAKDQAFNYKHNHSTCKYVIVSNFDKVQFYINDSVNKEEFSLFNMTREDFSLFYLCLAKDNILSDLPLKIKESSISEEKQITSKFYKDYTAFRDELYLNIKKNNLQNQLLKEHTEKGIKLTLFKKTQKLLDRFLFIFFAEDTLLLKHNFNDNILKEWEQTKKLGLSISLYDRYKTHFNYLDKGRAGTTDNEEIFAYNGGLFKPDPILDEIIKIDDDVLYKHSKQLSTYNFDSQVDVNILGHIFENSLNEIENITAEIEGDSVDKQKTKRKKDGIFYTPKYITKYIVDSTIGKLCDEKKVELKLNDIDTSANFKVKSKRDVTKTLSYETEKGIESHSIIKKTNLSAQAEKHLDNIEVYRNYLLGLTIVDPACGSGAFLNQALVFLINEHKYLDELQSTITGSSFVFPNIENVVLENNIFGVDINEESVEIAKLSLWLRTAQPRRKLNDLSNNIKCGNSLIDVKTVAGDKAFKWENEFPQVFANGGFDVVIGNPPYVLCQPSNTVEVILNFYKKFKVASYKIDLFHLFFEKSIQIMDENGLLGFITPNTYLNNKYIKPLRSYILNNTRIEQVVNYKDIIFEDAGVDVATLILRKSILINDKIELFEVEKSVQHFLGYKNQKVWLDDNENLFNINKEFDIKLNNVVPLNDICTSYFGIQAYDRKSSISNNKFSDKFYPLIDGGDINSFSISKPKIYFNYIPENIKSGGDYNYYKNKRIVISQIGTTPIVGIAEGGVLGSNTLYNINLKDSEYSLNYLLCILNSRLLKKYWLSKYSDGKKLFPKIKGFQLKELPIKIASKEKQEPFMQKADEILGLNDDLQNTIRKFIGLLQSELQIEKLSKKLDDWSEIEWSYFEKELKKLKITLTGEQKEDWFERFNRLKSQAQEIKNQINQNYKQIDQMVYELYGLTKEEIELVENSIH